MQLGYVTAILPEFSLEEHFAFAAATGYDCLEVMCWPPGKAKRRYAGVTHIDVTELDEAAINQVLALQKEYGVGISALGYYPNPLTPDVAEAKVYMRYTGQGWEIPIDLTEAQAMAPDAATFEARFEEDYTKLFGRPVAGMDIEITVWSVNATTPPEAVEPTTTADGADPATAFGTRDVFDAASGAFFMADDHDGCAIQTRNAAHNGVVISKVPVASKGRIFGEQRVDVIFAMRAFGVPGHLAFAPRREVRIKRGQQVSSFFV